MWIKYLQPFQLSPSKTTANYKKPIYNVFQVDNLVKL